MKMEMEKRIQNMSITLEQGDITTHHADAIVNAANTSLLGGGGVDGAIHRVGGKEILAACRDIRARQGGCNPGDAVITTAGKLPAKYVIHTVGPVWQGGDKNEALTLASCYRSCLGLAAQNRIISIAFPSISTGVYGYPVNPAAKVAYETTLEFLENEEHAIERVTWVLFDDLTFEAYRKVVFAS